MTAPVLDPPAPPAATARPWVARPLRATLTRSDLLDVLRFATYAVESRPLSPVLAGVVLHGGRGKLTAHGFDGHSTHAAASAVAAGASGRVLVEARRLLDMARAMPRDCEVVLTSATGVLTVHGGGVKYTLPLLPLADYPSMPELPGLTPPPAATSGLVLRGAVLADLARVTFAAGRDFTIPILTHVLLEHTADGRLVAVATDRYRLAMWERDAPAGTAAGFERLLVPAAGLQWAAPRFDGEHDVSLIPVSHNKVPWLQLTSGSRRLTLRLLDPAVEYPKYRSIVPTEHQTRAEAPKGELLEAVRRVAVVLDRNSPVRIEITPGRVDLTAGTAVFADPGVDPQAHGPTASTTVAADVTGEPTQVHLNPDYLADGLKALQPDRVQLDVTEEGRPIAMRAAGDALTYVLMPVRTLS